LVRGEFYHADTGLNGVPQKAIVRYLGVKKNGESLPRLTDGGPGGP
jgi:hypothetical protein